MSRVLLSLEHEVRRSGISVHQTMTYNPTTGKATKLSAVQNYFACLAELDNEELSNTIEVEILYLELESVGAGIRGGFTNTNELKVVKYQEAVNGPDEESRKEEIVNDHNRMLKNNVFEAIDENIYPTRNQGYR